MEATTIVTLLLLPTLLSLLSVAESRSHNKRNAGVDDNRRVVAVGGGEWEVLKRSLGISAMHMQLLPTGKLVAFDRTDAGPSNISLPLGNCLSVSGSRTDCTAHSVEFDPSHLSLRPLTITTETWCSSGSLSPNGTLVQTGGHGVPGDHAVRYLSPCDGCDWLERPRGLAVRRWYATNSILPDGRIVVVGGRGQFNYEFLPKSSPADYAVSDLPFLAETSDQWENNLYPFVHLAPDGNLFIFANTKSILFDHLRNRVVRSYPEIPGGVSRNYPSSGSSVLLPLVLGEGNVRGEVMVCGGAETASFSRVANGTFMPASSACGRLVITDESPEWEMEEMPMGRVMGDMVLLPTGDVLIVNGAGRGTAGWGNARDPVHSPVLYRTGTVVDNGKKFEVMSATTIPRLYHATAHLIPDGRVVVGGSNPNVRYEFSGVLFPTELSLEAFSPPYLRGSRPSIVSIKETSIAYGQNLRIGFEVGDEAVGALKVTMVSPSFTTHSFSMNQRLLVLETAGLREAKGGGFRVKASAPASAALAPPGYYMVFVVHKGVPSRGKWVHIS